ncbi:MAG: type I-B CRISPR-associated protein Cas7/Csh2 [Dethiobacteraceae bacterium]|jgi:CRISPR-associated protein Csh2|nr:type I-B CRISPR-associated protein Cas7/Csh2 [Bacillota bacterium]
MAFNKRREYLFLYSVKDANPNGDPLNANHPRFDAETGRIMVSDVRIKRTIRDQWLREGLNVFVDGAAKTLKTRIDELKSALKVKTGKEALQQCIDTKLFGVTFAHGSEAFSWTGPVQFKWGRSLHQAKAELIQGTAAFATRDESEQRSFRNEYIVPFVLLGVYGIANQHASVETGATDADVDKIADGLWTGTVNLITRSKIGHVPRLLLEVIYQEGFAGAAGSLDEKVNLLAPDGQTFNADEELALRSPKDFIVDISEVSNKLVSLKKHIEAIKVWLDDELTVKGLDDLKTAFNKKLAVLKR